MNLSRKLHLILVFVCFLLAGYFFVQWKSSKEISSQVSIQKEQTEDHHKLYPQELFYLDRNYPDFEIPKNLFQQRLSQAIKFDKAHPSSHRGLDHPWTLEGPGNIGGRVNTIAVHPANPLIILLGYS